MIRLQTLTVTLLLLTATVSTSFSAEQQEPRYRGRTAEQWIAMLKSEKIEEREFAKKAIKKFPSVKMAPLLVEMLVDLDTELADSAFVALMERKKESAPSEKILERFENDLDPKLRLKILALLVKHHKESEKYVGRLVDYCELFLTMEESNDPELELNAIDKYSNSQILPELLPRLNCGVTGFPPSQIQNARKTFVKILKRPNPPGKFYREVALSLYFELIVSENPWDDQTVDIAVTILKNPQDKLFPTALELLGELGPRINSHKRLKKEIVLLLTSYLKHPEDSLRFATASTLFALEVFPPELVPVLIEILQEGDSESALQGLTKLGPRAKPALPVILSIMKKPFSGTLNHHVRVGEHHVKIHGKNPGFILDLERGNSIGEVSRLTLAETLVNIGPAAIPELLATTKHKNPLAAANAVLALSMLKKPSDEVIETVIGLLDDKRLIVRREAVIAVGKFGLRAKECVAKLRELLKDDKQNLDGLHQSASLGKKPRNPLKPASTHKISSYRIDLLVALWQLDHRQQTLSEIIKHLGTKEKPAVNEYALERLAELGPAAKPAIPRLEEILRGNNEKVKINPSQSTCIEGARMTYPFRNTYDGETRNTYDGETRNTYDGETRNTYPSRSQIQSIYTEAGERNERKNTLHALACIGPAAKNVMPTIRNLLVSSDDMKTKFDAVIALGMIGHDEQKKPALIEMLPGDETFKSQEYLNLLKTVESLEASPFWAKERREKTIPILVEELKRCRASKADYNEVIKAIETALERIAPETAKKVIKAKAVAK